MKLNRPLTVLAVVLIAIHVVYYVTLPTLSNSVSMLFISIFPALWLLSLLIATILSVKNRKTWFRKNLLVSTLVALFFCTPVPFSIFTWATKPASYLSSSGNNRDASGNVNRFENWKYYNGNLQIIKFWKNGAKDGNWVYFDKNGDMVKTEVYKYGKLVSTKSHK